MGKAMNFKFGRNIHSVHPSKSPLEIWEKRERGRIRGLPTFLEYPLLSQERVKLQTANLAGIFTGSIRAKPLKNWEKRERGRIQGLPKFPLRASNFVRTFNGIDRNNRPLQISRKVAVGSLDRPAVAVAQWPRSQGEGWGAKAPKCTPPNAVERFLQPFQLCYSLGQIYK